MFTLYLACLIFGGILLGASLISFGGGESGGSDGGDLSHDADLSTETDISHDTGISHDTHIEHNTDLTNSNTSHTVESLSKSFIVKEAAQFFSFRNMVFFATFFGLTGSVFTWIGIGSILTLLSSLGMGAFSYVLGYGLMKYLRNSESGEELHIRELIGKTGIAGMPISKSRMGKVMVYTGSHSREYSARLSESSNFEIIKPREKILVIDIVDNCLIVDILEV